MKILLPVDGTPTALEAVHHALHLVRAGLRADFVLANVQDSPTLYEIVTAQDAEVIEQVREGAGADLLAEAVKLLDAAGVPYVTEVASGDPAHTLIDIAENHGCDAVIIGAERHGGLRGVLIGSVSQALLNDCPVPVTVVHRREPEEAAEEGGGEDMAAEGGEGDGG
jgi:nucleotide-binding universal stress UspA family protein